MQYYRCQCGKTEYYTTDAPKPCSGCDKCGTTFAQHPGKHKPRAPHRWKAQYNRDTGEQDSRMCEVCYHVEHVPLVTEVVYPTNR